MARGVRAKAGESNRGEEEGEEVEGGAEGGRRRGGGGWEVEGAVGGREGREKGEDRGREKRGDGARGGGAKGGSVRVSLCSS